MSQEILGVATQYSFYTGLITFPSGIIGNALNILVLTQCKLFWNNRSAFYLTIDAVAGFTYQIMSLSLTILTSIYGDDATGRSSIWCKFKNAMFLTIVIIAGCMISCAAVDQFFSTNYHFNLRQMCTLKFSRYLTSAFTCIWIIHGIVFSFFLNIQELSGCVITNSTWAQYSTFFLYPVLIGLLPITIASLFSILAYRNVRRIVRRQIPIVRRRLDRQVTAMVLIRVVVFVCLQTPYIIYRIYAINSPISQSRPMEYAIVRLVQVVLLSLVNVNYAISFYVFIISSSRYGRQVKCLFKKYWQRLKPSFCFENNRVGPGNTDASDANMEVEDIP